MLSWLRVPAKRQQQPDQRPGAAPLEAHLREVRSPARTCSSAHPSPRCTRTVRGSSSPSFQACTEWSQLEPHADCPLSGL